ncbi:MAG: putative membrane protein [Halioglobus sp.]|jgi:uncharacterized membrane protein
MTEDRTDEEVAFGSIDEGIAGDFELSLGSVLEEAWSATNGCKGVFNIAFLVYSIGILIYFAITAAIYAVFGLGMDGSDSGASGLSQLLSFLVNLVFYGVNSAVFAGFYIMGAKISMGEPAGLSDLFLYIKQSPKALVTYILMVVLSGIGYLLLVFPGIYLTIAYSLALPLALEKGLSPWQALETSRKAITQRWFTVAGITLVIGILLLLGVLTLGIAWIWLGPMAVLAYGIIYRNIFGLTDETLREENPTD